MEAESPSQVRSVADEIAALSLLIRETDSSVIAFALYRSVADREPVVAALKEQLSVPVRECVLSAEHRNPIDYLRALPVGDRRCVFFYDVEAAFPEFLGYVNIQRESFASVPHAAIFWVTEYGFREIGTKAPDFWAWRSGVFDFRSVRERVEPPALSAAFGGGFEFADRGDLERRVSLYEGLIREQQAADSPDYGFLARLQNRLAWAYFELTRHREAESTARQALECAQRAGDPAEEATAESTLGALAIESAQFDAADAHLRRALEISSGLAQETGVATASHRLGILAQEQQQFDEAEKWYHQALEISERLGLERYAASGYHQLGRIAEERQRFDEAEKWYRQALEIKERLGHPPLAVDTLAQFGVLSRTRGQFPDAVHWFCRAFGIAAEYKMPVLKRIEVDLALTMQLMGEGPFTAAWREVIPNQDPPMGLFRKILRDLPGGPGGLRASV